MTWLKKKLKFKVLIISLQLFSKTKYIINFSIISKIS